MNKYNDLELSILSCLLQNPKLMKKNILEDKYFINHKKIWLFLKAVYNKFGTFDFNIIYSISKDKYRIIEYLLWIYDKEPAPSLFEVYQKQLIELYEESKKEKWIIEKIYEYANELYVRNINVNEFKIKIKETEEQADKIFKE